MATRIAVPVLDNMLCPHFGHCSTFTLFDVDSDETTITNRQDLTPPHHEPGVYPRWLAEQNVTVVLAGGMGERQGTCSLTRISRSWWESTVASPRRS